MYSTKSLFCLSVLAIVFLAGGSAMAHADGVVIHHRWLGNPKVLNIHVTGAPADTPIEVIVTQMPEWNQEPPNGDPPNNTDDDGDWPGDDSGGEVGYPGTGSDNPGTEYVVSVIINGETGPSMGITKPATIWERIANLFRFPWLLIRDSAGNIYLIPTYYLWFNELAMIEPQNRRSRNDDEQTECGPSGYSIGRPGFDRGLVDSLLG